MEQIVRVGTAALVINGRGQVLFGLRKGSHGAGTWSIPGGHVDFGEEPDESLRREIEEETGLKVGKIKVYDPVPYRNTHFRKEGKQYITLYFTAEYQGGEPVVTEPDKCVRWEWFDTDKLPSPLFEPLDGFFQDDERAGGTLAIASQK